MTVGALSEIRRFRPDRLGWLRTLVILLTLMQVGGGALLLAGALGGWPPRLPGGGGIFGRTARGLFGGPEGVIQERGKKEDNEGVAGGFLKDSIRF
ncbi:MAG: hypothetical protein QF451_12240 [Nitrospinota bacterium]|nr:hypothetical protein [Nitrospinota bacterium]